MSSFVGNLFSLDNHSNWVKQGNVFTAKKGGALATFINQTTGQAKKHRFHSGGSFIILDDIISFLSTDVLPEVEAAVPVVEELAPLALLA